MPNQIYEEDEGFLVRLWGPVTFLEIWEASQAGWQHPDWERHRYQIWNFTEAETTNLVGKHAAETARLHDAVYGAGQRVQIAIILVTDEGAALFEQFAATVKSENIETRLFCNEALARSWVGAPEPNEAQTDRCDDNGNADPLFGTDNRRFRRTFDYWDQIREGQLLPFRSDIKLAKHADLAADCTIYDRSQKGALRVSFAGTEALRRAGRDITGLNVLSFFPRPLLRVVEDGLTQAANTPFAGVLHFSGQLPNGAVGKFDMLFLPVKSLDGSARYLLSASRSNAAVMRATTPSFFEHVSRLIIHPIDIGAGCPAPIEAGTELDFECRGI